ncbi:hypothetical protein MP638_006403 [Amoeboaphelidium occidentale]|nr:hypothetical protein MP638_006403 [Amoeboaphelidium occidentale]
MINLDRKLIAVGCGRTHHASDYNEEEEILIYAAHNSVAVASFKDQISHGVLATLRGHTDRVQSVSFFDTARYSLGFVSCSVDGSVRVWYNKEGSSFECAQILDGHSCCVNVVKAFHHSDCDGNSTRFIVSSSSDGVVCVWKSLDSSEFALVQKMQLEYHYCLSVAFGCILKAESAVPVLALGLTSSKISLRLFNGTEFVQVTQLEGHSDWIRSLHFTTLNESKIMLASGAQDKLVRLWSIELNEEDGDEHGLLYSLDSVLLAHEDWVNSVRWSNMKSDQNGGFPRLLTSSADKTVIVWSLDVESGLWMPEHQLGDVGGNFSFGNLNALWSNNDSMILSQSYSGNFQAWTYNEDKGGYRQARGLTGHFETVNDIHWSKSGEYLLSVSKDQTSRIFAETSERWMEVSRAQVHGYDLNCCCFLGDNEFCSGSDGEKIIRIFRAPVWFINKDKVDSDEAIIQPSLGLSNKATAAQSNTENFIQKASNINFNSVTESQLMLKTLWPESDKLYGHGDSVFTLNSSHNLKVFMSASVGRTGGRMEETAIRVWTVKDNRWTETGTLLEGHSLTVTRMSYSNDDNYVVTVGRDRKWMLFKISWNNGEFTSVDPVMSFSKAHSRIIWDVCWTPDDMFFITGSRDKLVAVWASQKNEDKFEKFTRNGSAYSTVKFEEAVTSVQCTPELIDGKYVLFVGLENGDIHILSTSVENPLRWTTVFQLPHNLAHDSAVKRIQIRKTESNNSFMVASCSEDNSVRLFDVTIC